MLLNKPECFILDVDGDMTSGQFFYSEEGKCFKSFGPDDNDGLSLVNEFLKKGYIDELIIYTSQKNLGKDGVSWFKKDNAVEKYGFKLLIIIFLKRNQYVPKSLS